MLCLVQAPLAQRLMMQESSLAQLALQSTASLPAISLGLPATTSARVGSRVIRDSGTLLRAHAGQRELSPPSEGQDRSMRRSLSSSPG